MTADSVPVDYTLVDRIKHTKPNNSRMSVQGLMISVSGIRGRVGEALTPEIVDRYAAGFGAWSLARNTSKEIVVARDSRVSGPMFHRVVVAALQSVGANVVDLDMAPTPTV